MRTAKILLLYLHFNELPSSNFIETRGYCVHCFGVRVIRAVTKIFKLLGKIIGQAINQTAMDFFWFYYFFVIFLR